MELRYWWRRCCWSLPLRRPHSSRTLASDYPPHHAGCPVCYVAQVSAEVFQPKGCPVECLSINLPQTVATMQDMIKPERVCCS